MNPTILMVCSTLASGLSCAPYAGPSVGDKAHCEKVAPIVVQMTVEEGRGPASAACYALTYVGKGSEVAR